MRAENGRQGFCLQSVMGYIVVHTSEEAGLPRLFTSDLFSLVNVLCVRAPFHVRSSTHRRDRNENCAQVALRQDGDRGRDREEGDEPYRACFNREDPRLNKKPNEACRKHQAAPEQLVLCMS